MRLCEEAIDLARLGAFIDLTTAGTPEEGFPKAFRIVDAVEALLAGGVSGCGYRPAPGVMLGYIASRVLQLFVTLLVITVLVFAMLRLIPGDPAMVIAGTYPVDNLHVLPGVEILLLADARRTN